MKKSILNLSLIITLLVGLLATVPVKLARADCPDGTAAADDIVCATNDANGVDTLGGGSDATPDVVTVNAGVTVSNSGDAVSSDEELSVFNSGSILSTSGDGVDAGGNIIDLTNTGIITGDDNGVYAGDNVNGTINNWGLIYGDGGDDNAALFVDGSVATTGVINNWGDFDSNGNGVEVVGDFNGTFNNYAGASVSGDDDGFGVEGDMNGDLNNWGSITAEDEDALIVEGDLTGRIVNYGDIVSGGGDGVRIVGTALDIYNAGTIIGNDGDGVDFNGAGILYSSGLISGTQAAIDASPGNDVVILDSGSLTIGGADGAVELYDGDDILFLGAGGVSYGTACGNINVTTVDRNAATVIGLMDGGDDTDTLIFGFLTPNQGEADAFAAEVATFGQTDTQIINDQEYSWANFEFGGVLATVYNEGTSRLHDDGVVLAFATNGGIAVCDGPLGKLAGTINFAELDQGVRDFSANGLNVHVVDLGGGEFEAHIFEGSSEHFNDANKDGKADSTFTFSR